MTLAKPITLSDLQVDFDERFSLNNITWSIKPDQHWLIAGPNGAGKSALAAALAGAGDRVGGSINDLPTSVAIVSYEAQEELIAAELKKDDADILDVIAEGTPVSAIIDAVSIDKALAAVLVEIFGLTQLMDRAFRKLSTGETRKVMLIRALTSKPDLIILDEPFDGIDSATMLVLQEHLASLATSTPMVFVLNRLDECPDYVSHIAFMESGEITAFADRNDKSVMADLSHLLHLKTTDLTIPPSEQHAQLNELDPAAPLVDIKKATIRYTDTVIFENLDWCINAGEHWQLTGPNGSGKTGLLSLITGDHPQCYVNDIRVFGYQRGSGESIWQIKQYIGYVSTALQWEYRVGTGLRHVIISGFYDSIGLYSKYTDEQRSIADQWLALLGMSERADQPFNQLSHGDKRLVLIARAMVKHPPLLILDEPCLGLDTLNRQLVLSLIEKICSDDGRTTVLYVNHHIGDKISGIEHYKSLGDSP